MNYQIQSVLNQLNPHFTFNALNAIGDAVQEGRKEEAYEYFSKLSDLIRSSMSNATRSYNTLGEELDFVKEYLEIEKYRFGDKLNWEVTLDPNIDLSISVPKMLIHIFVENAIKHGILKDNSKGCIKIKVKEIKNLNKIKITIEDDGIGIEEEIIEGIDKGKTKEGSIGLLNVHNRLKLIYGKGLDIERLHKGTRISFEIDIN